MPKTTTTTESYALLLRTDGTFELLDWPNGTHVHLNTLYKAIGCQNVAAVDITDKLTMWLDDEGLYNGSVVNRPATLLYAAHQPPHQLYYGHAVITGGTDRHGNTLGLTRDQVLELVEHHLMTLDIPIPAQRTN
ncbi:DUF3846 domain-containing protein [Streptomyces sp. CB03238]|uniref:DUF3846 domain-containing protein n=1 Tax=Streptomyces sp. CB03238 TaxID=1907777 RepID=UPI000A11D6FE|nr:DUF3846 domain-containing protein [Streptomyces sp. CB03238]ORT54185.1 hypothetical protein BKD26_35930 [Streptomyces sp. CB03238]